MKMYKFRANGSETSWKGKVEYFRRQFVCFICISNGCTRVFVIMESALVSAFEISERLSCNCCVMLVFPASHVG